jgi:hypothetical protein
MKEELNKEKVWYDFWICWFSSLLSLTFTDMICFYFFVIISLLKMNSLYLLQELHKIYYGYYVQNLANKIFAIIEYKDSLLLFHSHSMFNVIHVILHLCLYYKENIICVFVFNVCFSLIEIKNIKLEFWKWESTR